MAKKIIIEAVPSAKARLDKIVSQVALYVLNDIKDYSDFNSLSKAEKENWIKNEISRIESHVTHILTTKTVVEMSNE